LKDAVERAAKAQAALAARIPSKADFDHIHDVSDGSAREWAPDAQYLGCTLLMRIRGADAQLTSALAYHSSLRGETHTVHVPHSTDMKPQSQGSDVASSGRITDVTAWHEGWAAALESFRLDADRPDRSWHRELQLAGGVLSDSERGEIWAFVPSES
jgi:hypothetical protein